MMRKNLIKHYKFEALNKFSFSSPIKCFIEYKEPRETVLTNVIGTTNLMESIKAKFIKTIIVTTDKVYLNLEKKTKFKEDAKLGGFDLYSSSKAACDIIAESYTKSFFSNRNCGIAIVRSGNCIGGGDWTKDRIVKDCAESFAKNKKLIIRSPNATRPWQHVLDPLCGYLKLSKKIFNNNKFNGSWNFGPNKKSNLEVKKLVLIGKKLFNFFFKKIFKKKKYYESENLALDSTKSKKANWKTFSDKKSLGMTLNGTKVFINKKTRNP